MRDHDEAHEEEWSFLDWSERDFFAWLGGGGVVLFLIGTLLFKSCGI